MANEKVKVVLSADSYVGKKFRRAGETVEVAAEIAGNFGEYIVLEGDGDSDQTGDGDVTTEEA